MAEAAVVRLLVPDDLSAYKALRDETLVAHEDAFTSDAATESLKSAQDYVGRLGLDRPEGGQFTLGAFRGDRLVGAVSCEREIRSKVRHIGHVHAMMVRADCRRLGIGEQLLRECLARAHAADGIEQLTLSVTAGNPAERLYAKIGFVRYGTLRRAIKLGKNYHDKNLMNLVP